MKSHGKRTTRHILLILLCILFLAVLTVTAYVCMVAFSVRLQPDRLTREPTIRVVDIGGENMLRGEEYVPLSSIPLDLQHAFVAVEDKRFYRHNGVDVIRMGGAALANLRQGTFAQGASTITCQLIKNTHLNNDKTIERKIKEAKLALEAEQEYDKEEILEMYLNVIYFGHGLYGVGDAARGLYAKPVQQLSLAECASMAAITVNPALYSPLSDPENNDARKNMVLRLMYEQGYIDDKSYSTACAQRITVAHERPQLYKTYCIQAIDEAERMTGLSYARLSTGYVIHTYCDATDQAACMTALPDEGDGMAMLCTTAGHVVGYASTFALRQSGVRRQIGSTIKPFVYACAIQRGVLLPQSILHDAPTSFGDYNPANYRDLYLGDVSATTALAKSSNVAACKVLTYAGVDATYAFLQECGLPLSAEDKHLALALGGLTYGVTADELATAYTTLLDGERHDVHFVQYITDDKGNVVYRDQARPVRVMGADTAYLTTEMLQMTVRAGTAQKLGELQGEIAAKTGTVAGKQGNSDAWCVAYNARYIALGWQGNLSMKGGNDTLTTGGGLPCSAAKRMLSNHQNYTFSIPSDICTRDIDAYTLRHEQVLCLASPNTPQRYRLAVHLPADNALPISTTFEQNPTVDAKLSSDGDNVTLRMATSPLCTYWVFAGDEIEPIDRFEGGGEVEKRYRHIEGMWRIQAVLHGKYDLEGAPYEALIL